MLLTKAQMRRSGIAFRAAEKAVPNAFADGIEGVGVHPLIITIRN